MSPIWQLQGIGYKGYIVYCAPCEQILRRKGVEFSLCCAALVDIIARQDRADQQIFSRMIIELKVEAVIAKFGKSMEHDESMLRLVV
jgi:hypothetical protein